MSWSIEKAKYNKFKYDIDAEISNGPRFFNISVDFKLGANPQRLFQQAFHRERHSPRKE
jgi:hypothetical protein